MNLPFKFVAIGPERGDCTTPYRIEMRHDYTVREFIREVLTQKEWGYIYVNDGSLRMCDQRALYEYSHDKLYFKNKYVIDECNKVIDKKVVSVYADGGWSNMDYYITIEKEEPKGEER